MITPQRSNLSLYSLYYAEAWNEMTGPIYASLRPGNTASFEEVLQRRQAIGDTVSDLTGPRFKPQTSRSRDKRVAARPTGRYTAKIEKKASAATLERWSNARICLQGNSPNRFTQVQASWLAKSAQKQNPSLTNFIYG